MNALVLVDILPGFMPGMDELPVPKGEEVVPVANTMIEEFEDSGGIVVASQDWHPENHVSFASRHGVEEYSRLILPDGTDQLMCPKHCVQNTPGADFHPDLRLPLKAIRIQKGMDIDIDSHSVFWDNARKNNTGLADQLRKVGVTRAYYMGLATEVCLILSALDSVDEGFETFVIIDGCRAITPEGHRKAVADMVDKGISIVHSAHLLSWF